MSQGRFRTFDSIFLGLIMIFLMSCATQQQTTALPFEAPDSFSEGGTSNMSNRWWTAFDSDTLNALVDTAITSNFNLKTAWQRLQASRAVANRTSSGLFPTLEGSGGASVSQAQDEDIATESFSLGLSSVYEVDLWGRISSSVDAEQFRAQATLADYRTAALSLSAEIVSTWYQLAEARSQLQLVEDQIETNLKVLGLLENRFGTGQIRSVDILRQQQLVEATREQKTRAESQIQVLEHQMAVLLGRPPQDGTTLMPDQLPELPPLPQTGVPTDLIQRRPDVQSAFNNLQAADRDMASAISSQYPRLTFSASASSATENASNLFKEWAYSFAGNLLAPIFYGGELRAEVDRTEAVKQQRLYEYGQTVLVAFRELENALVREKKQRESISSIERQLELARQAYEQLRIEYFSGTTNYLDVLTALDEVQQLRRDMLTAELTLIEYRISLYRALAGSFETTREVNS